MSDTAPNPTDVVWMKHEASGEHAPARTTREAFDTLWSGKGWYEVTDQGERPASELRGAELDAALEAAGLSKSGTVAEKQARLAAGPEQGE